MKGKTLIRATPFTLKDQAVQEDLSLRMQGGIPKIGHNDDYQRRAPVFIDQAQTILRNADIASMVWEASYAKNKSINHQDKDLNIKVGDLILIEIDNQAPAWLMAMSFGFYDVTARVGERLIGQVYA